MLIKDKFDYFFSEPTDIGHRLKSFFGRRFGRLIWGHRYKSFGKRSIIFSPTRLMGTRYFEIGKEVTINHGAYLYALKTDTSNPVFRIGNGTTIGNYSHIVSVGSVIIEDKVLIADKVYIGDNCHNYSNVDIPIIDQKVNFTGSTLIGEGTWIGENVAIVSCRIGKHCVIGANSFVNKDIPDYSVACGNPAKVVKIYNFLTKQWEKTQ